MECTRPRQEYRVVIYCRDRRPTRQRRAAHDTASFSPLIFVRFDFRPGPRLNYRFFFRPATHARQLFGKFEIYSFFLNTDNVTHRTPGSRKRWLFNPIRRTMRLKLHVLWYPIPALSQAVQAAVTPSSTSLRSATGVSRRIIRDSLRKHLCLSTAIELAKTR